MQTALPDPPELDPASLAGSGFTRVRKGFEPIEVNKEIGRAADALRTWQLRDRSLVERIEALEHQLADASKLDESRIAAVLGEETARVISAAREAATEIRSKAEEQAARLLRETEDEATSKANALKAEAESLRAEAESMRERATKEYASRLEEAQRIHDDLISTAEARHDELLSTGKLTHDDLVASGQTQHDAMVEEASMILAERTSEAESTAERLLDEARSQGREMVAEAKGVRDRILADLAERRRTARRQIEGAVAGRDRIIEVMRQAGSDLARVISELDEAEDQAREAAGEAAELLVDDTGEFLDELDLEEAIRNGASGRPDDAFVVDATEQEVDAPTGGAEASAEDGGEALVDADGVADTGEVADSDVGRSVVADTVEVADSDVSISGEVETVPLETDLVQVESTELSGDESASTDSSTVDVDPSTDSGSGATVHDLFAKIRAQGLNESSDDDDLDDDDDDDDDEALGSSAPGSTDSGLTGVVVVDITDAANGSTSAAGEADETPDLEGDEEMDELAKVSSLLDARDELLVPVERQILRSLRRIASDEQNDVLDRLRRHKKGRPAIAEVIPTTERMLDVFGEGLIGDFSAAAEAGHTFWSAVGGVTTTPLFEMTADSRDRLVKLLGEFISLHRAHLERAMDQAEEAGEDNDGLAQLIKSVYRDWRQSALTEMASDLAIAGFSHGERNAAGSGTPWIWIVDNGGLPCADGEDNALAGPVPSDEEFPTGDLAPPAHAGCRCILVPAHN
ncbi:MAG: hypothetical protein R2735_13890 [Microthrixaceae bacterium]